MSESNSQLDWSKDKEGTHYANGAGGFKYEWMVGILYVFQGDILIFCIECGTMEHAEDFNKAILKACEEARKEAGSAALDEVNQLKNALVEMENAQDEIKSTALQMGWIVPDEVISRQVQARFVSHKAYPTYQRNA